MRDKRESQLQFEKIRDIADRFVAERYISDGFYLHFHRNTELYCVCRGEVIVTVSGDSRVLTDGQMALINGLESHSYEVEKTADIAYFHIGTKYMEPFNKVYGGKAPARWLTDADYNARSLYPIVETVIREGKDMTELEAISYGNLLLARAVRQYGLNDRVTAFAGGGIITDVIQYIYDNSDSDLNLETLAGKFGYAPQVLSRKISAYISEDLRAFINDVRIQKVMQMRNDDKYKHLSLLEIASRCGFNSIATFYRAYHRNFKYNVLPPQTGASDGAQDAAGAEDTDKAPAK